MLESLGLTSTSEAVYRTMLRHQDWGIQQIADWLGISKNAVKAAFDQLSNLTLISPADPQGKLMRPVSPDIGLTALLCQADAEVSERRHQLDATRAAIAAIAVEAMSAADRDGSAALEGVEAVRARIRELTATTSHECVSLNPNSTQTPDAKQASAPSNQAMLKRGVSLRCVYQTSFRYEPRLLAYARWLTSLGGHMRTVPTLPLLMIIYDRSTALIPVDPADTRAGALEIRSPGVVAIAYALFEQIWKTAKPFELPIDRQDEDEITPIEHELLQLLAAGHTDEQAARRLGISVTTVRRRMATLMERLDAQSRFQAGFHAAERGLLGLLRCRRRR
jgi:DNA-binding CsgD family transcriptional regulator